jgi:hypothetical protein
VQVEATYSLGGERTSIPHGVRDGALKEPERPSGRVGECSRPGVSTDPVTIPRVVLVRRVAGRAHGEGCNAAARGRPR